MNHALLPSGFMDRLPPLAAQEFQLISTLLKGFTAFGYQPVSPPLAEYTETMLAGLSEQAATRHMQVMDPLSGRMLALRADITGQIARIAATTLASAPRPLRLCYAGPRISATPAALQSERQSMQIGLEYIGEQDFHASAELLAVACHSLSSYALGELTIDISYPPLLAMLLRNFPEASHAAIKDAVANKNAASLRNLGAELLASMIEGAGTLAQTAEALSRYDDAGLHALSKDLQAFGEALAQKDIHAALHIDLLEQTDTEYYSGFSFALFCQSPAMELGRGGQYKIGNEDAVGFTFHMDGALGHLPAPALAPLVALPQDVGCAQAALIQKQGYRTLYVHAMDAAHYQSLGVDFAWIEGKLTPIKPE